MTLVPLRPDAPQSDVPIAMAGRGPRRLLNFRHHAGRFIRRLGAQALHSTQLTLAIAGDALLGAWALKVQTAAAAAVCDIYAGSKGTSSSAPTIFKLVGTALTPLPYNGCTVYNTPTPYFPWRRAELNDVSLLVCKRGMRVSTFSISTTGKLLHQSPTQVTPAGIPAPVAAPTVTDVGGLGSLPDGTWSVSYTFVTADGHESNESSASSVTTASGGTGTRRWVLAVSTHPRVTVKNLYLSKRGADNVTRYFLIQVPNATTSYDETFADSLLGFKTAPITNFLPPEDPEDVVVWDEVTVVTTSDPDFGAPGWAYTYVDSDGIPQFEAFDSDRRMLRIPPRGGQHPMCSVPWDAGGLQRLALFTDASTHIAVPSAQDDVYDVTDLDQHHGVPGPACAASGNGWLVWFDGHRVRATNGGDPITVSTDDIESALKAIPAAMSERACIAFRRADGGYFELSFASTSTSTSNDLAVCWDPADRAGSTGGWHETDYLHSDDGEAPTAYGTAPSEAPTRLGAAPGAIDLACFASDNRIYWQDSPALRDEGPVAVYTEIEWPAVTDKDGQVLVASHAMVAYGNRRDIPASSTVTPELSFSLVLNADTDAVITTTPVAGIRDGGVLHGTCHSLGRTARTIALKLSGYCTPAIEIGGAWLDVARVGLRRVS